MSTQTIPARAQRLHQLWSRLPSDPLTESELQKAILALLNRPGAQADASALMSELVGSQSVIATTNADGGITYQKAPEFPVWPEQNGPGSAAYDMQTKRIAEEFERQRDAADEEAFRNSPQNQQRVALLALIDQRIDQRLAELRRAADGAAVTRAREVLRRQNAEAPAPANTTRPG